MLPENDLYVDRLTFAKIACLDGRAFGVKSFCEQCSLDINPCMRRSIMSGLQANQALVEKIVGWNLTPRYHEEEVLWDGSVSRIQLRWPGVSEVNVKKGYTYITTAVIDPFLQGSVTTTDSGNGYCIVELDKTYFPNPAHAVIRNSTTKIVYDQQTIDDYPQKNDDGNWVVALDSPADPSDCPVVDIYHCQLMAVEMTTPDCTGEVAAYYSGTTKRIPFAKEPTDNSPNTIYWFYSWNLVDEAFEDEVINLQQAEYYKLVSQIDFVCEASEEQLAVLTEEEHCRCTCSEITSTLSTSNDQLLVEIVSSEMGILKLSPKAGCRCFRNCKKPIKVKVYYKTDPALLAVDSSLLSLQKAITYLTAAELPLTTCQCPPEFFKSGFIWEAQKAYTDVRVNPITGENIVLLRYGNLYGQLVFEENMRKVKTYSKMIRS